MPYAKRRWLTAAIALAVLAGAVLAMFGGTGARAEDGGYSVGSVELIENSDYYNQRKVSYTGEVIGDVLDHGEYSWITVNDDHYGRKHLRKYQELKGGNTGMGVYCRSDMLEEVTYLGSYHVAGDIIEVTGVFYQASPQHGGDTMIEAEEISVVRKGFTVRTNRFGVSLTIAVILAVVSLALGAAWLSRGRKPGRAQAARSE